MKRLRGEGFVHSGWFAMRGWLIGLYRRWEAHDAKKLGARYKPGVGSVIEAPLPLPSRMLLWALLGFLVGAVVWGSLGRVDVVATAQGTTMVNSRVQPVQSAERGIVTSVLVRQGERVEAGQPLVHMQHASARAQVESLRERLWRARADRARVRQMLDHDGNGDLVYIPAGDLPDSVVADARERMRSQRDSHASEMAELAQQRRNRLADMETTRAHVESIGLMLPYLRSRVERLERLSGGNHAPIAELDEAQREYIEMEMDQRLQERRLAELEGEVELVERQMDRAESRHRADLAEEYAELDDRLAQLREQLADAEEKLERRTLRAPRNGVIQDVEVHSAGVVVEPAEVLMRIVPEDQPLEVEARILNQDIGFAKPGQPVNIKFDAFEFTRFGSVTGTIRDIAPSSTEDEELGHVYRALVALDRNTIHANGREIPLRPGMTATVDIDIGERRLIEYFLGPILRYRDEALRER